MCRANFRSFFKVYPENVLVKQYFYIRPNEPAVNPIIRKNENSAKSRGKELTISFS